MKKLSTFFLIIVSCTTFWSCDDSGTEVEGEEGKQMIINYLSGQNTRTWKMTSLTINEVESIDDCHKDDVWAFNVDGKMTITLNDLCQDDIDNGKTSETIEYEWEVRRFGGFIDITLDGNFYDSFTIQEISDTELKCSKTIVGATFVNTYIWTYQSL